MSQHLIQQNESVYFEVRNILLKIREYKKNNTIPFTNQFSKLYQYVAKQDLQYNVYEVVEQILSLEEADEFVLIAFVNFYSKIFTCCLEQQQNGWLSCDLIIKILDKACKCETQYQPVYYEKLLKVYISYLLLIKTKLIRNTFELPLEFLSLDVVQKLWGVMKQTEQHMNLLIKELARDLLSQSVKRFIFKHWETLEGDAAQFILGQLVQEIQNQINLYRNDPVRYVEAIRLIEYPFSIIQFIIKQYSKHPNEQIKKYILYDVIFLLVEMSQIDHQVIINHVLDCSKYIFEMISLGNLDDVEESRTLFGQIVQQQLIKQTKKLSQQNLMEQGGIFLNELDISLLLNFLKSIFKNQRMVIYLYEQCDFRLTQVPLFKQIIEGIFELSRVSRRLINEESKVIQSSIQDMLLIIFQSSQLKKSKLDSKPKKQYQELSTRIDDFLFIFNGNSEDSLGPRKAMSKLPLDRKENLFYFVELLKFCNRISEQKMIEILGYHKEECVYIMEAYVASFNFHNLTVEEGLRLLLSNFLLFGESQMIERVLNKFTLVYFEQNEGSCIFKDSDSMYTYTYALILLNTDLYNKTNNKRMTIEDFLRQCAKINGGENLPEQYVRDAYNNIQQDEIKCTRDFSTTEHLTKFIWQRYLDKKELFRKGKKEALKLFREIDLDQIKQQVLEEEFSDLLLNMMTKNIEQMVIQYGEDGLPDLTNFLENVLQICIDNDKMDNAQMILNCMYNSVFNPEVDNIPQPPLQNKSPRLSLSQLSRTQSIKPEMHIHLYTCFVISKFMLPYLTFTEEQFQIPYKEEQFNTVVLLIKKTILFRHFLRSEILSIACLNILRKIRANNKFIKKNIGSNNGIFSLFQKFLKEEEENDDASDDDFLKDSKDFEIINSKKGIRSPDIMNWIVSQTKFLSLQSLNGFLSQLLFQICSFTDLDKEYVQLAQLIHLAVEILRINSDRLIGFWPQVVAPLSLKFTEGKIQLQTEAVLTPGVNHLIKMEIKKKRIRNLLEGFCKFTLLKISIEFLHLGEYLYYYEESFNQGLEYLKEQSLEIIVEFLQEITNYVNSNKLEDASFQAFKRTFKIIVSIYVVLEKRVLDRNDAKIIFDYTQEIYETLQLKRCKPKDSFAILIEQSLFLTAINKQNEISKICEQFTQKNIISIVNSYKSLKQNVNEESCIPEKEEGEFLSIIQSLGILRKVGVDKLLQEEQKVQVQT